MLTKDKSPVLFFKLAHFLRFWDLDVPEEQLRICLQQQREGRRAPGSETMPACIEIFDLQGVGFAHARCLGGLKRFARIEQLGQLYYPEHLQQAVLTNVPATAFAACWPVLKRVLDAKTANKIKAVPGNGNAVLPDLLGVSHAQACKVVTSVLPYVASKADVQFVVGCSDIPLFK